MDDVAFVDVDEAVVVVVVADDEVDGFDTVFVVVVLVLALEDEFAVVDDRLVSIVREASGDSFCLFQ